ncbi:hypothetical protein DFH08DRAFT_7828 [Mycena albidolilacea]|uniref:Uncharacterized protein n=1 Tax=Mycena albidolilacea TaxID=1033008 RepID=A0AAD7F484_9AGAR|nr:hypothetical protein DFH08DRAFT_7828 [Mycena albidolilacea]
MTTHDSTLVATGPPNLVETPPKKSKFRLRLTSSLKDQGNKAFAAKDYDKAIELFTQAIALDPKHVLFSNRSAAHAGKRQWTDALADAEQCVAMNSSWAKGYARKGAALHGARRYDEAIAAYEEGLKLEESPALRKGLKEVQAARAVAEKEATWLTLGLPLCESPTFNSPT